MKIFVTFLSLCAVPFFSYSVTWEIIKDKQIGAAYHGSMDADLRKSVGAASIQLLEKEKIPYIGNEQGLNSILGTPTGDGAIVIESNERMRVYGWCYTVDGIQPEVMPDQYYFKTQNSHLRWFYAYSLYDKSEWKSYCTPN